MFSNWIGEEIKQMCFDLCHDFSENLIVLMIFFWSGHSHINCKITWNSLKHIELLIKGISRFLCFIWNKKRRIYAGVVLSLTGKKGSKIIWLVKNAIADCSRLVDKQRQADCVSSCLLLQAVLVCDILPRLVSPYIYGIF